MASREGVGVQWVSNVVFGWSLPSGLSSGFVVLDPLFARGPEGLLRPGAAGIRGQAGGAFPEIAVDIDGQPRPSVKDIGCDQLSSAPSTNRPLLPADVGTSWNPAKGP